MVHGEDEYRGGWSSHRTLAVCQPLTETKTRWSNYTNYTNYSLAFKRGGQTRRQVEVIMSIMSLYTHGTITH